MTSGHRSTASALALACTLAAAAAAQAQTLGNNATGVHDGYYYTFWKDSGEATMTLHPGGRYSSQWNASTNNWVGGKGWNPGGPRVVNYAGYYGVNDSQNSYLALYGWTRDPLVEYYVVESYGSYNPASCPGGEDHGSFQSDGATYHVRRCLRENAPSIEGTRTFHQYFSVRSPKKGFGNISGTITVANHFDYWASRGLVLGTHDYMVLATEGYQSQGSSDLTVSEASPVPRPRRRNGSQPLAAASALPSLPARAGARAAPRAQAVAAPDSAPDSRPENAPSATAPALARLEPVAGMVVGARRREAARGPRVRHPRGRGGVPRMARDGCIAQPPGPALGAELTPAAAAPSALPPPWSGPGRPSRRRPCAGCAGLRRRRRG